MFALIEKTSDEIVAISDAQISYGSHGAVVGGVNYSDMFPENSYVKELDIKDKGGFVGRAQKVSGELVVSNPSYTVLNEEPIEEDNNIYIPLTTTPSIVEVGGVNYSVTLSGTITIKPA